MSLGNVHSSLYNILDFYICTVHQIYPPCRINSLQIRPVFLHYRLLVDLAHGIAFNAIDDLQHRGDLVRRHLLLELRPETL